MEAVVKSLESQIQLKDFKLNSLLEITTAINTNQNVEKITRLFEFIVREQLGYNKFVLFNKQDDWNCLLRVGYKGKVDSFDVEKELGRFQEITTIESSHSRFLSEFDVIVPVFHKEKALAYLLVKGIDYDGKHLSSELKYMSFVQT